MQPTVEPASGPPQERDRRRVVTGLGMAQIIGWGTSFYFPGVLASPVAADTDWPLSVVVGGVSLGLLVAGLISPRVGRLIAVRGGRPVLLASSVLFATGLAVIGAAPALPMYGFGWIIVGAAMGCGLYDAAFAALGRVYGAAARGPIAALTLFGGFASSVFWPMGAFLAATIGWRGTCFVYALIHLLIGLPLQSLLPSRAAVPADGLPLDVQTQKPSETATVAEGRMVVLLALILTLAAGIGSTMVVHLLLVLETRGLAPALAVSVGTLFGPAQVGARVIENLAGPRYHPIWTMVASCAAMACGLAMLFTTSEATILTLAMIVYAGGYGIMWIARGTLPLALFGAERYPVLMGRLAFPGLIVQALAPFAAAVMAEHYGIDATVALLTAIAAANAVLVVILWRLCAR